MLLWLCSSKTPKDKRSDEESGSSRQSLQHEPQDDWLEGTSASGHDDSSRLSTGQAHVPELSDLKVSHLPHVSSDQIKLQRQTQSQTSPDLPPHVSRKNRHPLLEGAGNSASAPAAPVRYGQASRGASKQQELFTFGETGKQQEEPVNEGNAPRQGGDARAIYERKDGGGNIDTRYVFGTNVDNDAVKTTIDDSDLRRRQANLRKSSDGTLKRVESASLRLRNKPELSDAPHEETRQSATRTGKAGQL